MHTSMWMIFNIGTWNNDADGQYLLITYYFTGTANPIYMNSLILATTLEGEYYG